MKNVISVVGAGGKTTLIDDMAKSISKRSKVLISTTTKMRLPFISQYDFLIIEKTSFEKYKDYFLKSNILIEDVNSFVFYKLMQKNSPYDKFLSSSPSEGKNDKTKEIISKIIEKYAFLKNRAKIFKKIAKKKYSFNQKKIKKNKIGLYDYKKSGTFFLLPNVEINKQRKKFMHMQDEDILIFSHFFDYILLESDGARKKRLKLPKEHEPVISSYTTATIAVIDIKMIGEKITEENTYNIEDFKRYLEIDKGDVIKADDISRMINLENGVFKGSLGEKILCVNKVEDETDEENARRISLKISPTINTVIRDKKNLGN